MHMSGPLYLRAKLAFSELLIGAQVYRSRGNVGASYEALKRAARTNGTREVIDWLVAIDEQYGRVELRVPTSRKQPSGSRLVLHGAGLLLPDQIAAVDFANQALGQEGAFLGLLPVGKYRLDGTEFAVKKNAQVVRLNLAEPK